MLEKPRTIAELPFTLTPESQAKLAQARKLVDEVSSTLNGKVVECNCCHLRKAENWPEAQLQTSLNAVSNRLEQLAGWRTNA